MSAKVRVELVVDRPGHRDNIYGTKAVWIGKGDVQEVDADAWFKMQKHTDVYAKAVDKPVEPPKPVDLPKPDLAMGVVPRTLEALAGLSDEDIHVFADHYGLKLHANLKGDNLKARYLEEVNP